jgi:hypothetical protein
MASRGTRYRGAETPPACSLQTAFVDTQAGRPTLCPRLRRVRDPPRDRRSGALIEAAALAAATTHEAAPVHACARVVCAALTG